MLARDVTVRVECAPPRTNRAVEIVLFQGLHNFIEITLTTVGALLPIVDPLGGAPIYLAMTSGIDPQDRPRMAKLVSMHSFLLLISSVLVGSYVLDFFGVSIPAVQIAGGSVLCAISWSLLNSPSTPAVSARPTAAQPDAFNQRAFYPLTMPLTVGPGTLSAALTLGANPPRSLRAVLATTLGHILGVLVVVISIYLCYRYADRILKKLGSTGTNVLIRLSSFITLCIGVQIIWDGVHSLLIASR